MVESLRRLGARLRVGNCLGCGAALERTSATAECMSSLLQKAETNEILQPVEADLLHETGGAAIEWSGRAATALYRAYTVARKLAGAKARKPK